MGIAFIGAVVGHVDRVSRRLGRGDRDQDPRADLQEVRRQGRRRRRGQHGGDPGGPRGHRTSTTTPRVYLAIDEEPPRRRVRHSVGMSASMCGTSPSSSALFDPDYYEDMIARPFRDGTIAEAPVLPGTGLFMPAGTARGRTRACSAATCRSSSPTCAPAAWSARWSARTRRSRTRCTTSTTCCSARSARSTSPRRSARRCAGTCTPWPSGPRELPRGQADHAVPRGRGAGRRGARHRQAHAAAQPRDDGRRADALPGGPHAAVLRRHGEGQSPAAAASSRPRSIPWKCTGCLECIDVCGPGALTRVSRTPTCWRRCRSASSS